MKVKNNLNTIQCIRKRKTIKAISDSHLKVKPCDKDFIKLLIESSYYAPFHYSCSLEYKNNLKSSLPWRFYILDSSSCRGLSDFLVRENLGLGKIIKMLNSADYLIQSTWCPQLTKEDSSDFLFDGNLINMEHLAASGAAIQNILLTATYLGHENYWSSGGPLREKTVYAKLGIPNNEILLGSIFIFPSQEEVDADVEFVAGKNRNKRGSIKDLYKFVSLI